MLLSSTPFVVTKVKESLAKKNKWNRSTIISFSILNGRQSCEVVEKHFLHLILHAILSIHTTDSSNLYKAAQKYTSEHTTTMILFYFSLRLM